MIPPTDAAPGAVPSDILAGALPVTLLGTSSALLGFILLAYAAWTWRRLVRQRELFASLDVEQTASAAESKPPPVAAETAASVGAILAPENSTSVAAAETAASVGAILAPETSTSVAGTLSPETSTKVASALDAPDPSTAVTVAQPAFSPPTPTSSPAQSHASATTPLDLRVTAGAAERSMSVGPVVPVGPSVVQSGPTTNLDADTDVPPLVELGSDRSLRTPAIAAREAVQPALPFVDIESPQVPISFEIEPESKAHVVDVFSVPSPSSPAVSVPRLAAPVPSSLPPCPVSATVAHASAVPLVATVPSAAVAPKLFTPADKFGPAPARPVADDLRALDRTIARVFSAQTAADGPDDLPPMDEFPPPQNEPTFRSALTRALTGDD